MNFDRERWIDEQADAVSRDRAAPPRALRHRADELIRRLPARETPLESAPAYTREELRWLAECEHVTRLADLVLRRTSLAFTGAAREAVVREVVGDVAHVLHWSPDDVAEEIRRHARPDPRAVLGRV